MDSRAENGLTALHLAAIAGSLPCVQALVACGANMMLQTVGQGMNSTVNLAAGSSVLHAAVKSHKVAIIQIVLQVSRDYCPVRSSQMPLRHPFPQPHIPLPDFTHSLPRCRA
jgi:ankyrin repeat protein